jgi:chloramphenicol-sensitive protein RarD
VATSDARSPSRDAIPAHAGVLYAVGAYLAWGLVVIYWKALGPLPALEVLAHRIVWSLPLLAAIATAAGRWGEVRAVVRAWTRVRFLVLTTLLISANWGLFIWAVQSGRVLQASLGYFINPLVNVVLGVALLGEKLRHAQKVAVGLAACGVVALAATTGTVPWTSLALAVTFGLYGLLRKVAPVDALTGLLLETCFVAPLALAYVLWRERTGVGALTTGPATRDLLLAAAGVVTVLPLLWFASAARRLPLSTLGFFQYLSPSCQFLLAVGVYGERLTVAHAVTFGCIWTALAIFSLDARVAWRARER